MDLNFLNWDWDQESYPVSSDLRIVVFFAPFFLFLRFILDKSIFESIARRLISSRGHSDDSKERRERIVIKFKESAWKCLCSLSIEAFALYVTYKEPWFRDTRCFWLGPGDQIWPDQKIKYESYALCETQETHVENERNVHVCRRVESVFVFRIVVLGNKKIDFKVMLVHHIVTSFLVMLSYIFRFARIGSVILALHDISDVFLEIGKICKYSGAEAMTSVLFVLFFLSWTALRLIYYPFWILWSTSYESIEVKMEWDKKHMVETRLPFMVYYVFNTLLFCLQILHIYWWVLICRVLIDQIRDKGKIAKDVRSDSESEDDQHQD